ncbi:MAG: YcxB family protein [Spirochaetales bacterium]|nr:YcxB family protein [Spirochaetales bacterium]
MIEVKTGLDKVAVLKLNQFHLFRKKIFLLLIFMILFVAFGLVNFFYSEEEWEKYLGLIFAIVFGLGFPLLCYGTMKFIVWLYLRSSKFISGETKINYRFDTDIIYYSMEKSNMKMTCEWEWNLCYKAYETKEYYFIYISNMQAHIVPKKDIIVGTSQELTEILKHKIVNFKQVK